MSSWLADNERNMITSSSTAAAASVNSTGVSRRPDDGLWYDFSDPPSLLFYAYSAFVDDRPLEPRFCNRRFLLSMP